MRNCKRILSLILSVVLILSCFPNVPFIATAATASGTCGDNLTWTLDNAGTLTISGTGAMGSWVDSSDVPWDAYKSSIKKVTIMNGVNTIGNYAFWECASLTSITIPNSITSICDGAFAFCNSLTSVTIPNSVTSIGDGVFYFCRGLTGIWVDENNSTFSSDSKGVLFNKEKTSLIEAPSGMTGTYSIPDSVTAVGDHAFAFCESMTNITIPSSVISIGDYAFCSCDRLTGVTISKGVTSIGYSAFEFCTSLTDVYYDGTQAQWDEIDIRDYNEDLLNATLHVTETVTRVQLVAEDGTVGATYGSFEDALDAYTNGYLQLIADIPGTVQISKDVYVDLNGFDMTVSIDEGANLYAMDNKTDDYVVGQEKLGVLTVTGGTLASETVIAKSGEQYRYLALPGENNTYTFHRFSLDTKKGLRSFHETNGVGLYYQPILRTNEVMAATINANAADTIDYGIKLTIDKAGAAPIYQSFGSFAFDANTDNSAMRVALYGMMPTNDEVASLKHGNVSFNGTKSQFLAKYDISAYAVAGQAYIRVGGNYLLDDANAKISLKEAIIKVDSMYDALNATQKTAVDKMYERYSEAIKNWGSDVLTNIGNIKIDISDWFN